jgi:general secretion pathway protein D
MVMQQFCQRRKSQFLVLAIIVLLSGGYLTAVGQDDYDLVPYEFITLKNIAPEQGKKFLDDLGIGTISHIPGSPALLVTAQPRELAKAKAVLNLIDEVKQFAVQDICPAAKVNKLTSNEQIAAKLGNISIGSFTAPPAEQTGNRAIIDFHNNALIAIAPTGVMDKLVAATRQFQNTEQPNSSSFIANTEKLEQNAVVALLGQKVTSQKIPQIQVTEQKVAEQNAYEQKLAEQMAAKQNLSQQSIPQQTESLMDADVRSVESVPIPNADDIIKLTLPEKLSMVEFLGMVGPYLRLDFMYNEADLANHDVTFNPNGKLQGPITVRDLYHLLESVLKFKGFVMTRGMGNLVTIVPKDNALDIDPALVEAERPQIGTGDVVVMSVFELKHIGTESAKEFLEGMKLTTDITSIAETKTLIVTAYAHRMPRIKALLDIVDRPGEPRKFRFRQLRYTMAQSLAPKLQTLAEELGTVSITIAATEETTPTQRPTRLPNESTTAYNARIRAWQQRLQRERQQATRRGVTAQQGESVTPTVYLDADERTNRILMIGLEEQLDDVEELIDTLDVAQQDLRTLIPYKIEYLDAEEVRKKLEEFGIIGARTESTTSLRGTSAIKAPATTAQTPAARAQAQRLTAMGQEETTTNALAGEPQVVVIEPINSLLVNATEEQHERIASIISHVDQQQPQDEIPYKIYPLENSSPAHLRDLLMQLIEETVESQQPEDDKIEVTKRRRLEEQITIVDDPNTFSLIVYANKKNQEWISSLIKTLDKRRPQVLIDVTLVEISRINDFELDLDLVGKFPRMVAGGEMDKLPAILEPFAADRVIELTHTDTEEGRFGQGFYSDRHIQALLKAIQTKSYGRVLAKPKILVNDGQPGSISTAEITNVKIEQVIIPQEGTQRTTTDYREYEAGINLTITPNISEGDLLLLKVNMTRSDFDEKTKGIGIPPDTTESVVDTTVTVPDGQTIILGGLIKIRQSKGGTKVPVLGDIPLLGGLFRSTNNSDDTSNLYVFVKANILRPDDTVAGLPDLERMSDRNRVSFERLEDKFQNYENWPGFKPKPMEPFKVLEAE